MRVGLSFDLDGAGEPEVIWRAVVDEVVFADNLGYDSAWVDESREGPASSAAPSFLLTFASRRTRCVQLRAARRQIGRDSLVRVAEEVAVLDLFSRGRAGVAFAAASRQGLVPEQLHEAIDFLSTAWSSDEFRYRGAHVRFPEHTLEEAPVGASGPPRTGAYKPQWEQGPAMPDYLAITPKPYALRPPIAVEIDDDATLEWAAHNGVSPLVGAETSTDAAVERLARYRTLACAAGRRPSEVEVILERTISLDGEGDGAALGGSARALVEQVRGLRAETGLSHLVWRRRSDEIGRVDLLVSFAREVQPLLQA